jgi:hypothetical protein
MTGRNKSLIIYGVIYIFIALTIYFGLRYHYRRSFSNEKLQTMISGKPIGQEMTTDLCLYQILGDPKETGNYVKISFACNNEKKVNSTLSLKAIEDKTIRGIMKEYARIIGFDISVIKAENFDCYVDGKLLTEEMQNQLIRPTADLNCIKNQ